jgi:hypothetical protein
MHPNYAKQTQCQVGQNQPMFFYNKHLGMCWSIGNSENKPNSKPIQTQFKPISKPNKPNNQLSARAIGIIDNQLNAALQGCQFQKQKACGFG